MRIIEPCFKGQPMFAQTPAVIIIGAALLLSCGRHSPSERSEATAVAHDDFPYGGCFSITTVWDMSREDERSVRALSPLRLDTAQATPSDTSLRVLGFAGDSAGDDVGVWQRSIESDSLFWRIGDLFTGVLFRGALKQSTFSARVFGAGDIEPFISEMGTIAAQRIDCPNGA